MGSDTPPPSNGREVNRWRDDHGVVCGRAFSDKNFQWLDWCGVGVLAFSRGTLEVQVWPERNVSRDLIVHTFFRMLQPLVLQALGWQVLHAGATAGPKGALAFCGKSGSGKSTLAFAMQRAGWRQFADDALVLRFDGDEVLACPVPFTPRLRPPSRIYFGEIERSLACFGARPLTETPLAAVFLLRQEEGLTSPCVSLLPPARAFSQLLAHAHCFDATDASLTRALVTDYLALTARVPVFTFDYPPEFEYLPQVTRALLEATGGSGASSKPFARTIAQ